MNDSPALHQLKVTLRHVRPPVWRRLQVPSAMTLSDLDGIIRASFDWGNFHLHEFDVDGVQYRSAQHLEPEWPSAGFDSSIRDEATATLRSAAPGPGDTFHYTYDFGDDWVHKIEVEALLSAQPGEIYPTCVGGRGLPPEEDTGAVRPGTFDRASLDAQLQATFGVPGRSLVLDAEGEGAGDGEDPAFGGLFPELAVGLECSCGQVHDQDDAPTLRRYRLAPAELLAEQAGHSQLIQQVLQLVEWVGDGRALTPTKLLRPREAAEAVEHLGLPDIEDLDYRKVVSAKDLPELHQLWSAALRAGLLEIRGARVYRGEACAAWSGGAPEARVTQAYARSDLSHSRWRKIFLVA